MFKFIFAFLLTMFCGVAWAVHTASSMPSSASTTGFPTMIYPGNQQKVSYSTSTRSAAFGAKASVIRVICTTDCHIAFGTTAAPTTPTAAADGTATFCKAGVEYYFGVIPGSKIAVIQDASAGLAYIAEGL